MWWPPGVPLSSEWAPGGTPSASLEAVTIPTAAEGGVAGTHGGPHLRTPRHPVPPSWFYVSPVANGESRNSTCNSTLPLSSPHLASFPAPERAQTRQQSPGGEDRGSCVPGTQSVRGGRSGAWHPRHSGSGGLHSLDFVTWRVSSGITVVPVRGNLRLQHGSLDSRIAGSTPGLVAENLPFTR